MIKILGVNYFDCDDIKNTLIEKYKTEQFDATGNVSILAASFVANKPFIIREPNYEYVEREIQWYLSESLNVHDIPGKTPKIWEDVSDKDGFINSNYGWTTFSEENYNQFDKVVKELSEHKSSRQGVIIFIRPTMHEDSKRNGMHDFICTYCYNFKIEDNKLYMIVNMRSNDCVYGYDNDYAFANYVFDKMLEELRKTHIDLEKGVMFWRADNFHVYPRHFKFLEN
ncbi:MAG: dCMP hydroxymethylase [Bacilli bacterium]|nr:dCMP hydroxymethylase [Bacilli bacterium]MBQ3307580.1 dCMP hydroxymethylase [Bacilli bacterium]MBQ3422568.1 hypothetical protein [Romboutsia sp.]